MVNLHNFILESRLFKKLKVDNLLFTEYKCLVDEERGEVWSHTNYFAYGISGKKLWQTINGNYFVKPGKLIFVRKGANVVYQYFEEEFLVIFIFVPDEFIKNVIEKNNMNLSFNQSYTMLDSIIPINVDEILQSYFQSLTTYFKQNNHPSNSLLKLKFEELILSLLTSRSNPQIINYFKEINDENKISIREIMEANFANYLSIEEYAQLSARSISTFKRDFYNLYNMPPGKWLTEKRLEYSCYLIRNTKKNIQDIMLDSGFKNRSHFVKIFKDRYGVTPLKFRTVRRKLSKVV